MSYSAVYIYLKKPDPEGIIQATLGEIPFEGILEKESEIIGYIKNTNLSNELIEYLNIVLPELIKRIDISPIPAKNWNEEWEKGFKEVKIGRFCQVRASFHKISKDCTYSIVIDPKMAFGTGHHETTYMMIESMQSLNFTNKKVFDFGCGTGILAILASKLGARKIVGIDNEPPAIENAIENGFLNEARNIYWSLDDIEVIKEDQFDIILANINRNVLLKHLPLLSKKIRKQGILIISGILLQDEDVLIRALNNADFIIKSVRRKGDWVCILSEPVKIH